MYAVVKERSVERAIIRETCIIILNYCKSFLTGLLAVGLYTLPPAFTCSQGDLSKMYVQSCHLPASNTSADY